MRSIDLYNGEVRLEFDDGLHAYRWNDRLIPGVTKILSCLNKPALVQWAANMAVDFIRAELIPGGSKSLSDESLEALFKSAATAHRKLSKSATDIGKDVHAFAERALVEQRVMLPEDPQTRKGCEAFMGWLHATDMRPIAVERMVFSRAHYYAGTCDYYGHINDKRCVMDLKTSSGLYLEMLLQIAAYSIAISEETGEQINDGWIVRLDKKTGKCHPYHIPITTSLRDAFLRVLDVHRAIQNVELVLDEIKARGSTRKPMKETDHASAQA